MDGRLLNNLLVEGDAVDAINVTPALRILLIEDEELDRLAARRCLQQCGMPVQVEEAASVDEVQERISAASFDGILLNCPTTGVEGLHLLRAVRDLSPDTPVLVLTERSDDEFAVELMKAGAADCLTKASLSPARLAAGLRLAIELREARRARRRVEAALHEQSEWLRVALSSIGDGVIATDTEGAITFLNPVAEQLTGWTMDEARGQPLTKIFCIVNEQTRAPVDNPALRAIKEGSIVGLANHTILIAKDGTQRAIDDSGATILNAEGQIIGAVLIFRDVTERRRLERDKDQRAAASRLLAAVVDSSEDAIISKSLDGTIQSWNLAAERLFGYTAKEAIGRPISMLIPPDRTEEEDRILTRIQAGERVSHFDTQRARSDGRLVPVGLTLSPIRDEQGRIIGASKIARDITVRKRAENLLRLLSEAAQHLLTAGEADELIHGLFEKIKEPLGVDVFFKYAVNEVGDGLELVSFAGIDENNLDSIRHLDLDNTICGTAAALRQPIHAAHIQQSDDPMVQLVKSLGIRAYACHPLLAEYRLLGILSFASRSKDEFAPEELDFLRTVSHYVTAAFERLRYISQLRDADRRKDEFLATLAHELRSPLAPMRNMLELMKLGTGGDEVLDQARDTMERQLGQLVHLVDDLLDLGRVTRNKIELRCEDVLLESVVDQAVEAARPLVERAKHELSVQLPAEPIELHADPVRLVQVLGNLLTNACKYTQPGGRISVTAERAGGDVLVRVKDNGIGIPPDQIAHVFEIFSQVQSARERSQGGLGIGLALVRRLVEMHSGSVKAHSDGAGCGSEFVVRLPALATARSDPRSVPAGVSGRRILIVDDSQDAAKSLAILLRVNGNATHTAYDGLEAVEAAERFRPDVVLMDIGLPRLSGYDACRRIREKPWGESILMLALTGWGQDEDRHQATEAGFDHHFVKPVDLNDLLKVMAEGQPTPV